MARERWRFITNLSTPNVIEERFMISEFGRVWDSAENRFLKTFKDDEGYSRVYIPTYNGFLQRYVHRLVKIEFDGLSTDPNKCVLDHIDCDKSNNTPNNLEWVTNSENVRRAMKNGLYPQFNIKLTDEDAEFICQQLKNGISYKDISNMLYDKLGQDSVRMIGKIYRGERWRHISEKYMPFPEQPEKGFIFTKTSVLTEKMVHDSCAYLSEGHGITETAKYIQNKYNTNKNLVNAIANIKHGKTHKTISKQYGLV